MSNMVEITKILTDDDGLTVHEISVRCVTLHPDRTTVEYSDIVRLYRWFVHISEISELV